jgi:hypothetical protein
MAEPKDEVRECNTNSIPCVVTTTTTTTTKSSVDNLTVNDETTKTKQKKVIIHYKKSCVVIDPKGRTKIIPAKLEAIQDAVGGYIETVPSIHKKGMIGMFYNENIPYDVYCNEEGLIAGLPQNEMAAHIINALGYASSAPYHLIYGPVVIAATELEPCKAMNTVEINAITECCARLLELDGGDDYEEKLQKHLGQMVTTIVEVRKGNKSNGAGGKKRTKKTNAGSKKNRKT